ncbi:MAG: oligoribonuclease [Candidatus Omnitrophota bacterium]
MKKSGNLVWIDLEMTGLDPKNCTILEIGAVVTDSDLNLVEEGPPIAIRHSEKTLRSMEAWSRHHHKRSGLTDECRASKISMKKAERLVLDFVRRHCREKTSPLCGNTVWQDRRFLVKFMPKLEAFLHYRVIDVSSIKELVARWYPSDHKAPRAKSQSHRVLPDILESIEELRHYRDKVFLSRLS